MLISNGCGNMSISNNKIVNNFNNMAGPLEMLNISTDFWSKLVPPCKMVFDLNCVDRLLEHTNAIDYIRYCFNNSSRAISYYEDIIRNNSNFIRAYELFS